MNRYRCRCCARLLENTTESNSEFANTCRRPCGKNNACAWTPYMVENRSTGGLAPPLQTTNSLLRFGLVGCSVELPNLKLPSIGVSPRSRGRECQLVDNSVFVSRTLLPTGVLYVVSSLQDTEHVSCVFHPTRASEQYQTVSGSVIPRGIRVELFG